jgi:hypothetical protein
MEIYKIHKRNTLFEEYNLGLVFLSVVLSY